MLLPRIPARACCVALPCQSKKGVAAFGANLFGALGSRLASPLACHEVERIEALLIIVTEEPYLAAAVDVKNWAAAIIFCFATLLCYHKGSTTREEFAASSE